MRKTLVLQHVRGPKWLPDENIFLSRTLSFWSLKSFFSSLLGDSSDGVSSFLAIRSHCESSLSGAVSLQWGSSRHLLLPWLLTVGRSIVQEVGCHFPFPFDLNHPATLQHVPFVCKHLVEVCSHLWAERNRADLHSWAWVYQVQPEFVRFLFRFSVTVAGCCRFYPPEGLRCLLGPNSIRVSLQFDMLQFIVQVYLTECDVMKKIFHKHCNGCNHISVLKFIIYWHRTHFLVLFLTWMSVIRSHMKPTCMRSGTPVLSIRLATLTVFPQISYWGLRAPITPATTGPMFRPEN